MTIENIREYLRDKIDNSWYYNAHIDYGVSGRFLDAQPYGDKGQHLYIFWEEDGKRYKMPDFSTQAYSLTNPSSCITSKAISSPYSM